MKKIKKIFILLFTTPTFILMMGCSNFSESDDANFKEEIIEYESLSDEHNDVIEQESIFEDSIVNEIIEENNKNDINGIELTIEENAYTDKQLEETTENFKETAIDEIETEEENDDIEYNVEPTDKKMFSTTSLNVRYGPATSYDVFCTIKYNDEVNVSGICDNGWIQILINSEEYYANGKYLSDEKLSEIIDEKKDDVSNQYYNNDTNQDIQLNTSYNIPVSIEYIGNIPTNRRNALEKTFSKIQENILTRFNDNGWKVIMTEEDLATKFYSDIYRKGTVLASTNLDGRIVWFDNRDGATTYQTVYHELGHIMDDIAGTPSLQDEWNNLYLTEKDGFICTGEKDGHSKTNSIEYFAACFSEYFINNNSFQNSAPNSYEYMKNFINNL